MPSRCLTSNTGAFLLTRLHPKQPPGLVDSAPPHAPPARWPESLLHSAPSRDGWKVLHGGDGPPAEAPGNPGLGSTCGLGALVERGGEGEGVETGERGRTQPSPLRSAPLPGISAPRPPWAGPWAPLLQPRSSLPWAMR